MCLTLLQCIEQFLKLRYGILGLVLCLGLACSGSVLKFEARFMKFFLCLATLFFQLGQQFFCISQRLRAGVFQMLKQAAGELMEQV